MIDVSRKLRIGRVVMTLRGWGLARSGIGRIAAATLLAEGGPLPFLGAQALYFAAPLLGALAPNADLEGLAGLLDDPESVRALAQQLAEAA